MEYHSSTYLSHWVVHRTNKLQGLIVRILFEFLSILFFSTLCVLLEVVFSGLEDPVYGGPCFL